MKKAPFWRCHGKESRLCWGCKVAATCRFLLKRKLLHQRDDTQKPTQERDMTVIVYMP